jgi:hypothetical protein
MAEKSAKSDTKQGASQSSGKGASQSSGKGASKGNSNGGGKTVSPVAVQKALKGIHYPASKQDLLKQAQQNSAPEDVMRKIQNMPGENYSKPTDVMQALGKTE